MRFKYLSVKEALDISDFFLFLVISHNTSVILSGSKSEIKRLIVMVNDALKFKEYCKLWNGEPKLYMRFNNISHDDRFLIFHFDEFDE